MARKKKALEVLKSAAIVLLAECTYTGAEEWSDKRIKDKLMKLPELMDEEQELETEESTELFQEIVEAVNENRSIKLVEDEEVDEDEEEPEPAPKKKSSKGKKSSKSSTKKKTTKAAKKSAPKKAGGAGKPGIIASIIEFLEKATAKKPITKEQIVQKLANRFKDRDPDSMAKTVNVQVPTRLKTDKDLEVKKNDNGYWLPS